MDPNIDGILARGLKNLNQKTNHGGNFYALTPTDLRKTTTGVPQGAPTSPLLSILIIKDFLKQVPSISFADDPIFYSRRPFQIKDDPAIGVETHKEGEKAGR